MVMKKIFFLLTTAISLLSLKPAHADFLGSNCCDYTEFDDWTKGLYVGGFGGANFLTNKKHHGIKLDFNTGYTAGGAIGYRLCDGIRLEVEGAYRHNKLRKVKFAGSSVHAHKTNFHTSSVLVNAVYDFKDFGNDWCWSITPYAGAGIGYGWQKVSYRADSDASGNTDQFSGNGRNRKNGFAWQLLAGLTYDLGCDTDISLEYRFFKGRADRFYNNSVDVMLRYYFN